jgi:hypothetical protein
MDLSELRQRFEGIAQQNGRWQTSVASAFDLAENNHPDYAMVAIRKAFANIVEEMYREHTGYEPGSQPLEGQIQALAKKKAFPAFLIPHAELIKQLGNAGAHGDDPFSKDDVRLALEHFLRIVDWRLKDRSAVTPASTPVVVPEPRKAGLTESIGIRKTKRIDRLHQLNPTESIPGRSLLFGLREIEIKYLWEFSIGHRYVIRPSAKWPRWARLFGRMLDAGEERESRKVMKRLYPLRGPFDVRRFRLSRFPVTNEQFKLFTDETEYETTAEAKGDETDWRIRFRDSGPDHPVTNVSLLDAKAFCAWAGVRLPTRDEFERAVRGISDTLYPWGPEWKPNHCNDLLYEALHRTKPVDFFRQFPSADGVCDLCGNVYEWVTTTDPGMKPDVQLNVGGAFNAASALLGHAAHSERTQIEYRESNLGFRFAQDVD